MKLAVSKKQEEALYILRLEGLRRQIELTEATEEYDKAKQIEKTVSQYVVDNNEYVMQCHDIPELDGKRVVDEFDICMIDEDVFTTDYLPKLKTAFMELYGIDNPLNFVYSYPMHERKIKAERSYQMLAAEFLKICGRPEAAGIENAINTYLRKDLKDRLYKINDSFIGGK